MHAFPGDGAGTAAALPADQFVFDDDNPVVAAAALQDRTRWKAKRSLVPLLFIA